MAIRIPSDNWSVFTPLPRPAPSAAEPLPAGTQQGTAATDAKKNQPPDEEATPTPPASASSAERS